MGPCNHFTYYEFSIMSIIYRLKFRKTMLRTQPYIRAPGESQVHEIYDRALVVSTPKPYSYEDATYPYEVRIPTTPLLTYPLLH